MSGTAPLVVQVDAGLAAEDATAPRKDVQSEIEPLPMTPTKEHNLLKVGRRALSCLALKAAVCRCPESVASLCTTPLH